MKNLLLNVVWVSGLAMIIFLLLAIWFWDIRWFLTGVVAFLIMCMAGIASDTSEAPDGYLRR